MAAVERGRAGRSSVVAVTLGLAALCGCGGGHGGGQTGGASLAAGPRAGRLALPAGSSINPASLAITSAVGHATPGADGSFTVTAHTDGPVLLAALTSDGKATLLGFVDAQHPTLDARSTADMLVYLGLGGWLLPTADARARVLELVRGSDAVTPLANAIAAAIMTDPNGLVTENPAVIQAAQAAISALLGKTASRALLVQPSDAKSGVRVNIVGANSIQLVNEYRRRVHVFVNRVSYVGADGGAPVDSPAAVTDFQVAPVTGIHSLAGTIVDLVLGNVAYAPVSSDVIPLPVTPDGARKTTYRVAVVGAGGQHGPDYPQLTADEQQKGVLTGLEQVLFDMLLPLVINVLGPNHQGTSDVLERMRLSGLRGSLIVDFTQAAPDLLRKLQAGDNAGALRDSVTTFLTDGTLRDKVLGGLYASGLVVAALTNDWNGNSGRFMQAVGSTAEVTRVLDAALQSFDTLTMGVQLLSSNHGDLWSVDATQPKVRLTPDTSTLAPGASVDLKATVPELAGTDAQVVFQWSNPGQAGHLTDGTAGHVDSFESTHDTVTYTAGSLTPAQDVVQVEAFQLIVGQGPAQKVSLGTATATVTVPYRPAVRLSPVAITIQSGAATTFTAAVEPQPSTGSLEYHWSSSTAAGDLSGPSGRADFTNHSTTATYQSRSNAEGQDSVTVEVFHVNGASRDLLGTASSSVTVQKNASPQQVTGRLLFKGWVPYQEVGQPDRVQFLMLGVFVWKKVPGFDFYDLKLTQQAPDGSGWTFQDMPGWGPQSSAARVKYYTAAELRARYPGKDLALSDDELYWDFPWGPIIRYDTNADTTDYEQRMAGAMSVRFEATPVR